MSLQGVAARAEVGVATAYRYFSSLDELLEAYTINITEELRDFARQCPLSGRDLYNAVLSRWITLVLEHGKVMVQLRSRSGYLHRLDQGDPVIATSRDIWEQPLRGLLQDLSLPDSLLRHALFLNNALSDPREILELSSADAMTSNDIASVLAGAVAGALRKDPRSTVAFRQ
ncbi:TetR/AcrR family transcriptional regulator [Arthrobacter sp. D1-29]